MPFSFNPGQTAQAAPQGGQGIGAPLGSAATASSSPTVPDSPFLFIQQRGKELTINAYLQIIILLIATLSILSAITLFAYSYYLTASIESKKQELTAKESGFKDYPLDEMKRLSDRALGLDLLLKGYVSIESPLKFLEDVVERQVVFSEFNLAREKTGGYVANFTAVTKDYQSLIQQLEALKLTQYSKIAPSSKFDRFSEEKNLTLKVKITTPVFVQGLLPDDIVFVQPGAATPAPVAPSTPLSPTSTTTASSTTP